MPDHKDDLTVQIELWLHHIASTFSTSFGVAWFADSDTLYLSKYQEKKERLHHCLGFLSGYYYRFLKHGTSRSPLIVDDVSALLGVSEDFLDFVKEQRFSCMMVSPLIERKHVYGVLVLVSDDAAQFSQIDSQLFDLLTKSLINLQLEQRKALDQYLDKGTSSFGLLIGKSPKMRKIYKTILQCSHSDCNVFISGEEGTGKELVARTIYAQSKRKDQSFIPVDCDILDKQNIGIELFGYDNGAFNGGQEIKRGLLEYADKGTIFLDEITELPNELQGKLSQVLLGKHFRRLGGEETIALDVRTIVASKHTLEFLIASKLLRPGLLEQVSAVSITLPPLRERREDIPLLVDHFINELSKPDQSNRVEFSPEAIRMLVEYEFPENVRELRRLVENSMKSSDRELIVPDNLPVEIVESSSDLINAIDNHDEIYRLTYTQAKKRNLMQFERIYFSRLMETFNGNISRVAREADVSRKTIYNILQKNGLNNKNVVEKPIT